MIVNGDHDGDSYLVALKRATGETVWKVPRKHRIRSYCPPLIRQIDGRTQMVLSGAGCVASYDPHNGKQHWVIEGPTEQYVASLVYNGKLLFHDRRLSDLPHPGHPSRRPGRRDQDPRGLADDQRLRLRAVADSSPAAADTCWSSPMADIASCFEAQTGERYWKERIGPHYQRLAGRGRRAGLLPLRSGRDHHHPAGPGIQAWSPRTNWARTVMPRRPISQGRIYIRGEKNLYCIGNGR